VFETCAFACSIAISFQVIFKLFTVAPSELGQTQ
jgi:hypothetical protein